jgi:hypothetical protein
LKKKSPKTSTQIAVIWISRIVAVIGSLFGCIFITTHIFYVGVQYYTFESAKRELLSWDLPPQTELIDLRTQRVSYGTFCIAEIDMIVDSKLSRNAVRAFYLTSTPRRNYQGHITEGENRPNGLARYTLNFEMEVFVFWDCS